jgi:uncharacterized protein
LFFKDDGTIAMRWPKLGTVLLALEFCLLFIGGPLAIFLLKKRAVMLGLLWVGAIVAAIWLHRKAEIAHRTEWNWPAVRTGIKPLLTRFAILAPLIAAFTIWLRPEMFLSLPSERPLLWLMIMILYPLLSVWPQEVLYRSFLYHRYARLWNGKWGFILASALSFGFAHIVFSNIIAVSFTVIGGALFAYDYAHYKSLALAWINHALYGGFIFTIGLGWYFYGAAWMR